MKFSISGLLLATLLVSVSGAQTATHGAQTATQKSAAKAPAQASQARRSQPLAITGGARSTSPAEWLYAPHWNGGWFYGRYALPIASPFSPYNRALFPDLRLGDATLLIDGPQTVK